MKPTISEETLQDIICAVEILEDSQWKQEHRDGHYDWVCQGCGEKADTYDTRLDKHNEDTCSCSQRIKRLQAFARIEEQLHEENSNAL